MDKAASLGYLGEKVLDRYMKDPPKIDISSVDSVNDFISGAPAGFSNQQLLMAPLLTAGAGGLYGYLASSPQNRKRNAIVGALGGGLIGGGASLGYKLFNGLHTGKVRKHYTLSDDTMQQQRDNLKLLEEQHKSWNPFKGELIETTTGRPIAKTELPHRIEEAKKLLELWPQIPDAAEKYQRSRSGVSMGVTGGGVGLALAKILDESVPSKPEAKQINKSKKDKKTMNAKTQKKADSTAAIMGGLGGLVPGAVTGAGAGGLYGLVSGAYQAEKGKKLRGALTGLGRGLVGGGLIGGGIGAGAGAGAGLTLPRGLFTPFGATLGGLQVASDPIGTASRAALGGVGGAALGGYLGNKVRKSTLGEPKKDEEKSEEKSEKKDNKPEEKEERKAAAFLAALKEAELKLSPLAGTKKPSSKNQNKILNEALEKARKAREEKEKTMPQQNKAANDDDYRSPFSESKFENIGVPAIAGAGLGGIYGALTAPKKQLLRSVLRGSLIGGAAGAGGGAIGSSVAPALAQNELNRAGSKPEFLDGFHAGTSTGLSAGGGGLVSGLLAKRLLDEYVPLKNHEEEKKTANDGWRPFDYSNVGPGGLISQRTLPKSDGTGGAKSWKPAVNAPPSSHPSFQQPGAGSRLVPVPQPQQPKLVPVAAGGKTASAYAFGKMIKRSDFMSGLQSVGDYAKGVWNSPTVQGFVNDPTTQAGLTYGGIGAGLGGLYGLINPGEYEDEMGNVRRRGRFSGALRGALGGGAIGGLAGAGAQEGRFQYLKHLMRGQNNEDSVALPHVDRATAQSMAEQFAQNNPDAVGMLGTSPLQSASNAYSVASNAVKGFMPKRMGSAPSTGVQTPVKPPEVKTTDEQP